MTKAEEDLFNIVKDLTKVCNLLITTCKSQQDAIKANTAAIKCLNDMKEPVEVTTKH